MRPMRTDQDTVNKESREKLDQVSSKKRECAYTRKSFKKYLRGHLFKLQKIRIDRHLKTCVVCSSEFDALKRMEETRLFLQDVAPAEGLASRLRELFSALARLKVMFYRPLWMAGTVLVAALVYHYAIVPRQIDIELESIVKTAPISTLPAAAVASEAVATTPSVTAPPAPLHAAAPQAQEVEVAPLAVTFTVDNAAAVLRINEVMRGHGRLRNKKFSDDVREISGALTAGELLTFFDRIASTGKVSYSRRRFESFPSAQPIPFVLKLRKIPGAPAASSSPSRPVLKAAEAAAPAIAPAPAAPAPSPAR